MASTEAASSPKLLAKASSLPALASDEYLEAQTLSLSDLPNETKHSTKRRILIIIAGAALTLGALLSVFGGGGRDARSDTSTAMFPELADPAAEPAPEPKPTAEPVAGRGAQVAADHVVFRFDVKPRDAKVFLDGHRLREDSARLRPDKNTHTVGGQT